MLQNMTSQPLSVGLDLSYLGIGAISFWTVEYTAWVTQRRSESSLDFETENKFDFGA